MQCKHQWNVSIHRGSVTCAVQQVGFDFSQSQRQSYLFPKRIGRPVDGHDMHVGGFLQTNIIPRADQYEVFVLFVYLLQFPDGFQSYIVHAMLFFSEDALGFYCYFHLSLLYQVRIFVLVIVFAIEKSREAS